MLKLRANDLDVIRQTPDATEPAGCNAAMQVGAFAFFLLSQSASNRQLVFLDLNRKIAVAKTCNAR